MAGGHVLVNGAAGFLGSAVVRELREAGYDVRATDRPGTDLTPAAALGAEVVHQDLLDAAGVRALMEGVDTAANVVGLFDFTLPYEALYDANVRCTENMARAALDAGLQRFVHVASIAVYGLPVDYRVREESLQRPRNGYERTKKLGEDLVWHLQREAGLPATSIRPALIYGPGSRYGQALFIGLLALMTARDFPHAYFYDGGPEMHHVQVEDAARAIRLLLERDAGVVGKAFNCADDTPVNWGRWLQWIAQELDLDYGIIPWYDWLAAILFPALVNIPRWPIARLNDWLGPIWEEVVQHHGLTGQLTPRLERAFFPYLAGHHVYDTSRLASLGFTPRHPDTEAGVRDTVRWYIDQRWLPGPPACTTKES